MTHYLKTLLVAAALFLFTSQGLSFGQVLDAGPQVLTFFSDVDDTDQPYAYADGQIFDWFAQFQRSVDNVVAEGRFDDAWRIPAADAEKMKATGAVTVSGR